MIISPTNLDRVFEIGNKKFQDHRGLFVKTYHFDEFEKNGLQTDFRESFYSVSKKNVLRGMHFQKPPHDHAKLVYVIDGEILDVAVDIRKNSSTFGKYFSTILSAENSKSLYVGRGFAHGFLVLSNNATVVYQTSNIHVPESDKGVRWDSFGFDWGIKKPIISDRDASFLSLKDSM